MIYSGNKLLNYNNTLVLFCCGLCAYININNINHGKPLLIYDTLIIMLAGLIFTIFEAWYFELTDNELIVHNYMLPFTHKHYTLADITQIVIGDVNTRSASKAKLKITSNDKTSMGYRAGALAVPDWQKFIDALGDKQINVRISASRLADVINFK